jgi:fructokinase
MLSLVIVVCGEALIDMIRDGAGAERASPGGGPFNTARALARLGVPTTFLGHFSDDKFGRELTEMLVADGAGVDMATIGPEPTTVAVAEVDSRGVANYRFVVDGTSAPGLTSEMLPARFPPQVNALHVGSLGLVLEPIASTIVELVGRERGRVLISLDPNVRVGLGDDSAYRERLWSLIPRTTVVKASDTDLAWLYPDQDYCEAADLMLKQGPRLVVVTLGADGAYGAHRDMRIHVAAPPVEVVDAIGAGEAFGAGLLTWLHDHELIRPDLSLEPAELRWAVEYACLAASLTCARAGADPPWKREMVPVS